MSNDERPEIVKNKGENVTNDEGAAISKRVLSLELNQNLANDSQQEGVILLDHYSRTNRWTGRLARYLGFKQTGTSSEPISAFMGSSAPTEVSTPQNQPSLFPLALSRFSLIDVERNLLVGSFSSWFSSSSQSHSDAPTDLGYLDIDLSEAFGTSTPDLFLGYYSSEKLLRLLEKCGIVARLGVKGYTALSLVFDTSDSFQHRLSLVDASLFSANPPLLSSERFLIDIYMKRREVWSKDSMVCYQQCQRLLKAGSWEQLHELTGELRTPYTGLEGAREVLAFLDRVIPKYSKRSKSGVAFDVTEISWMQMQDPFHAVDRKLLPGQKFPGLGIGKHVGEVMENMAANSKVTDALLNFPFHWHNAFAYRKRGYIHIDPIYEAYTHWLELQLQPYLDEHGYCFVAWAISTGFLRRSIQTRKSISEDWTTTATTLERWTPSEQVYPTSSAMTDLLHDKEWDALFQKYSEIFEKNGGAQATPGEETRIQLSIDIKGCPELWIYSPRLADDAK